MSVVTARLGDGTVVELQARDFVWRADESAAAGGSNTATPYEMLLGGLASCIALTLRLYATHKAIRLDGVDVRLTFDRVHADDCERCDERVDGFIERVQTAVTLHGTFTDARKVRLTQVAHRCPVHKTLVNGVDIIDDVAFQI